MPETSDQNAPNISIRPAVAVLRGADEGEGPYITYGDFGLEQAPISRDDATVCGLICMQLKMFSSCHRRRDHSSFKKLLRVKQGERYGVKTSVGRGGSLLFECSLNDPVEGIFMIRFACHSE